MSTGKSLKRKIEEAFCNSTPKDQLMVQSVTCKRQIGETTSCGSDSECDDHACQAIHLNLTCPRCFTYMPYLISLKQDRGGNTDNHDNARNAFEAKRPFDFGPPDECLFGSIVANRLKKLADDQKIYAEKIINDALHYAMLNRLSSTSNVTL